jgi:hypothetical protein
MRWIKKDGTAINRDRTEGNIWLCELKKTTKTSVIGERLLAGNGTLDLQDMNSSDSNYVKTFGSVRRKSVQTVE